MSLFNEPSSKSFFPSPLSYVPLPPDEQLLAAPRQPWLYSAILGNGRLLVCLDEAGSIAQLFYPNLDAGPHVYSFLIGIQALPNNKEHRSGSAMESEQEIVWLAKAEWTHELRYVDDSATVHCISTHPALHIQIDQEIVVHHIHDALINEIRLTNLGNIPLTFRMVIYAGFDIGYRQRGNTCYFDSNTSTLLFFADDCYISVRCDKPVHGFDCNKSSTNGLDSVLQNACHGQFNGQACAIGQVRGSVSYELGQIDAGESAPFQMHMCFGRSIDEIINLSTQLAQSRPRIVETSQWWQKQYIHSLTDMSSKSIRTIYNRSLITLRLLTDISTGGIIAAPECDPDFGFCDGYGFCWPRDGALIGHTLDTLQYFDHARAFYDWALRVQEASGAWYHRYYTHGTLAPPICGLIQFDEIGVVVWALCRHIQLSEDLAYGRKVFTQLLKACEYMQRELDPETGLAPITKDLWEERDGISTYACACTWAAFNEFALLSDKLGLAGEAQHWSSAATLLKKAIEKYLWDSSLQRFLRGIKTKIGSRDIKQLCDGEMVPDTERVTAQHSGRTHYILCRDTTIDISLLGLSTPFEVFSADDPRMIATAEAIEKHLTSPVGGIYRYQGDTYRGGNPWIICTLWLALQYMQSDQKEKGRQLYNWAVEHRTSLDLFTEQIDNTTGKPCWVNPLGWSHAMFLLATRAYIKYGLLENHG